MVTQNSNNLKVTNNAEGYDIAGGTTTRKLTITGADMVLTGSGTNTYTFPSATDTLVGRASTDTLTNKTIDANGTGNSISNIDVADLSDGTDGELITWSSAGAPTTVAVGTATHVLTSNGVGVAPTFQAAAGGGDVSATGTPADNEYAKWTDANTIEGRSYSEVRTDLNIEDGADVTDTDNVTSAGALMDSEVTNLAQVKAFDSSDYATDTQGGTADSALQDIVDDTTPELGGELDAGAHSIGFTLQTATGDGTTTIDWKLGNKFKFTFGAQNETFTFTAPSNPCSVSLIMVQDGTGSRTATWPATVKWAGGTAPTLTTDASSVDIISFYFDGTSYFGVGSLNFS